MSESLLLLLIRYLDINYREDRKTSEKMERVIKEMREILDIVRDEKLEERRSLNYLVSDLADVAVQALHDFKQGAEIGSILNWIKEIKRRMLKLGDVEAEMEPNMKSSENVEDDVAAVGLEKDVEFLLRTRIIGGGEYSKNILIIGMAGIGKTTLAREIYNHPNVVEHFEHRAWACSSTNFTMKELLIRLILQVDPENLHTSSLLENMDNPSLLDMLFRHLQGKRYLIVLDDVPKQMRFSFFWEALPRGENGGRLLLTSHTSHINIDVYVDDVYNMAPLDSEKSLQLFLKTINHGNKLTGDHKFPMDLHNMGNQMLIKCDGLPLVIKDVGKQLVEKKLSGGSEWEQLLESVNFGSTLKLLEPFYLKLDPKLKSCFMSMSFFKENTTLRAEKLTEIWVAGGVVSRYDEESYLEDLISESVIDVKDKSTEYRMNAVLHMLSIQKAEEKLGFEILRNNGNNRPSESPRHHRVIICSRDKFNYSTDQDRHLVSLFFHGGGYFDTSSSYWKSFEELKILDLDDFGLKFLPETIGTLMEVRYLGLRNNYIKELPESLECLKMLEVLDMAQNFMVEVPDIIWKLRNLRHLYMSDVICRKPLKIGMLQFLETLSYVSIDNWTYGVSGFKRVKYLEKLGIEELDGNSDVSKLFETLADVEKLKHLILRGYRFRSMPCLDELAILHSLKTLKLDGLLARLPNNLPPNIESLTLVNSCLDEDPMPLLGKLWQLKYLKLRNAFIGQEMAILYDGFPRLEVLCIEELWNLRNVKCENYALIWLMKLEIHDCPYLDTLPDAILSTYHMKEMKMVTTKSIATKIRNSDLISKIEVVNISP